MRKGVMAANREKIVNLIVVHLAALSAIFLISYVIKDAEEVRKRQEECEKRCYPAKTVKFISLRHCMCIEESLDNEEQPE